MAAEDLKHLFANEEAEKLKREQDKQKASDSLELVGELSFNTDSMVFNNLPLDTLKKESPKSTPSVDSSVVEKLISRLDDLEGKVSSLNNDFQVNTLVELKLLDQKVSGLLQRIIAKSATSKPEAMAIKKLIVEAIKKVS